MKTTRVLVNLGGLLGLSMALTSIAEPPPAPIAPAAPAAPSTPAPAAPAVPAVPAKVAPAAEPAREMSKQAAELLEKAKAAAKAAKDVSATTVITMKSDGEGDTRTGKFIVELKDGMMPIGNWRLETAAKEGESAKVFAFDGKALRGIDPSKKEMTEMSVAGGVGYPQGEEGMLIPMWFLEQRQDMMAMMKPKVLEQVVEGEVGGSKVGEEKVTIVRQVRSMAIPSMEGGPQQTITETTRVFLAADNLPRRAERVMELKGGEEAHKQEIVQTFEGLKVNTTPSAETFTLKAPEGYQTRQVAADEGGSGELKVKTGDAAPEFSLKDAEGKEYKLADFKGKIVLLDFWATWCGPCKQAMPSIQKISETFKDKAVAVIGVNTWEKGEKAGPEYMKKQGFTYLNLLKGDDLAKAYGVSGIPTLILIDKDGKILHTAVGFGPSEEAELTKMINEKLK